MSSLRVSVCDYACMSIGTVPTWLWVPIFESACHCGTCESETHCVSVTRGLVTTGGGKQDDLYSFDQARGRGWGWGCQEEEEEEGWGGGEGK